MNNEIEQALLGSLLVETKAIWELNTNISAEMFADYRHRLIFEAMKSMQAQGVDIDYYTLASELKSKGLLEEAGNISYLMELTRHIRAGSNYQAYGIRIYERYLGRRTKEIVEDYLAKRNYETDALKAYDDLFRELEGLNPDIMKSNLMSAKELAVEHSEETLKRSKEEKAEKTYEIGIPDLDKQFKINADGNQLVVLAGPPSHGKTATAIQIIRSLAVEQGVPTLFKSLEMTRRKVMDRMFANMAEISYKRFDSGELTKEEWDKYHKALDRFDKAPLWVDDSSTQTPLSIKATIRRLAAKGLKVVIIDYFQLLKVEGRNKSLDAYNELSCSLREMSKDLNITIIILSQLNRKWDSRIKDEPGERVVFRQSDLKETSQLEQDAHFIAICNMPQKYNSNWPADTIFYDIPKHREGYASFAEARLDGMYQIIRDMNEPEIFKTDPLKNAWPDESFG